VKNLSFGDAISPLTVVVTQILHFSLFTFHFFILFLRHEKTGIYISLFFRFFCCCRKTNRVYGDGQGMPDH
ncbi:MAG: hypothetical protein IJT97_01555, partial [Bacteroidaceae bacterium]|nr:hypothetical protein [Bacteroidaceae bacterium]